MSDEREVNLKISYISDLHLKYNARQYHEILRKIRAIKADTLVLAGDIEGDSYFWASIADTFKDIVFIAGNHDYYGYSLATGEDALATLVSPYPNVYWLNNSGIYLEEQHFYGSTLWFSAEKPAKKINDFNYIRDFDLEHQLTNSVCQSNLKENVTADTVVITHHMPSYQLASPKYKNAYLNQFFVCDILPKIELPPKYWIYGHTHVASDVILGRTRCVCNPYGYYYENTGFEFGALIEI